MFRKVAFLEISRRPLLTGVAGLQYSVCNATDNELLTKFLKYALKHTENSQEIISTEVPYQKFTDLQTAALRVFKVLKVTFMMEFLSSGAGANGFSTEYLLQTAGKTFHESLYVMKRTSSWIFYFIINLDRQN